MNLFLGKKYTDEELVEMTENGKIKEDNSKFQNLYNIVKYSFPINFVNVNTAPTLCQYGGKDPLVGIVQYSKLYKAFEAKGIETKIKLIYMKYGGHELVNFSSENGLKAMRDLNYFILDYAKIYFQNN